MVNIKALQIDIAMIMDVNYLNGKELYSVSELGILKKWGQNHVDSSAYLCIDSYTYVYPCFTL